MTPLLRSAVFLTLLTAVAPHAVADHAQVVASHDNTLYQDDLGSLSNGSGQYIFSGTTAQGIVRRGLISFDLTQVPAGATIQSVSIKLHMSRTAATGELVSLVPALQQWGEGASAALNQEGVGATAEAGDATWLHTFYSTSLWNTPGGDFASAASATTVVGGVGFYSWSSPQLVADVQSWVNSPGLNFGWGIMGDESPGVGATAKRFDSRENGDPAVRPSLSITYIVPAPGGGVIMALAAVGIPRRRRGV